MALNLQASPADPTLRTFLTNIQHGDAAARATAIKQAPLLGTEALTPLAQIWAGNDPGEIRSAGESFKRIVQHATRPGALVTETKAARSQLVQLLDKAQPRAVRADALQLLGLVGSKDEVPAVAALLSEVDVREDARMALERIPGREAESALSAAKRTAPPEYQPALDQSLKNRKANLKTIGTKK